MPAAAGYLKYVTSEDLERIISSADLRYPVIRPARNGSYLPAPGFDIGQLVDEKIEQIFFFTHLAPPPSFGEPKARQQPAPSDDNAGEAECETKSA